MKIDLQSHNCRNSKCRFGFLAALIFFLYSVHSDRVHRFINKNAKVGNVGGIVIQARAVFFQNQFYTGVVLVFECGEFLLKILAAFKRNLYLLNH